MDDLLRQLFEGTTDPAELSVADWYALAHEIKAARVERTPKERGEESCPVVIRHPARPWLNSWKS